MWFLTRRSMALAALAALLAGPAEGQGSKADPGPPAAYPGGSVPGGPVAILDRLPDRLTTFSREDDVTDFEARPGGAGLGAALNYGAPGAPVITVYVYDRERRGLRDAASGPAVEAELVTTRTDIETASRTRRYRIAARGRAPDEPGPEGGPGMRCDRYVLAFEGGGEVTSFACVAVMRGRFLKVRVSHPRRAAASPDDVMPPGFVAAFLRAMSEAGAGK